MNRYKLPATGFASKGDEKIFWQRVLEGYRGSKLSRIAFCEHYGLKLSSFKRWVTRLNRELTKKDAGSEGLNFVQVKVSGTKEVRAKDKFFKEAEFEIELLSGDKLRLPLCKDILLMTIKVLKGQRC